MSNKRNSYFRFSPLFFYLCLVSVASLPLLAEDQIPTDEDKQPIYENNFTAIADWRLWQLEFTRSDMDVLPNGNHNFFPLEHWAPNATLSNPDTGGFSLMEPVTLSIEGESFKWLRYHLNSLDITNPADPGRPFIYMPIDLWNTYKVLSPLYSYSNDAGINWDINNNNIAGGLLNGAAAGFMGGSTWIPKKFMDREPSQDFGASDKRRSMTASPEGSAGIYFQGLNGLPGQIFYEGITHRRTFATLNGYETGNRNTVYLGQNLSDNINASAIYQHLDRDHYGIETGNADTNTLKGGTDSVLVTIAPISQENSKFTYGINAGYGYNKYVQNNPNSMVYEMVNEIVYGKMPLPSESKTGFISNNLDFNDIAKLGIFDVSAHSRLRFEADQEQLLLKNNIIAQTYNNAPADFTVYTGNGPYTQYLARFNPELKLQRKWESWNFEITGAGLLESGFTSSKYLLTRFDPTAAIKLSNKRGSKWEIYTGLQHDAIPLSTQELAFLNPDSPSGARYAWNDNGDGIPQPGEAGTLYNVTGGKYHTLSKTMKYPTRDEFYFGVANNITEKWSAAVVLHGKYYTDLYSIAFDPSVDSGYSPISSTQVAGGILYDRNPAAYGRELYMLTNSQTPGYVASLEIQVLKKNDKKDPWFFQLSMGADYAEAHTIPGNGPDYNDMGQYAESSANPNKQISTRAITDSERAYRINILFGLNTGPFSIANTLRYRDGEPWGNMLVAQGLSDGPVIVQDMNRSQPPMGVPRYTFALTWDVKLRYELPPDKLKTSLTFDIYNLFDSRTELYEYTLAGQNYRKSIESVIGRSFRLGIHMKW